MEGVDQLSKESSQELASYPQLVLTLVGGGVKTTSNNWITGLENWTGSHMNLKNPTFY